ncbi:MAG: OmpA family protein [Planctomycetota bacterium]
MKKVIVIITGLIILTSVISCASEQYKKEIGILKQEKWELEQKNARLENDLLQFNYRCELLIKELKKGDAVEGKLEMPVIYGQQQDKDLAKKLKGLEIVSRDGNITVVISDLFNAGVTSLSDSGNKKLKEAGKIIKSEAGSCHFRIDGYTDNTPIHKVVKYKSNEEISLARAEVVKDFLVKECGFIAENISVTGLGEKNPIADNKTEAGKKKNRRVEIVILK